MSVSSLCDLNSKSYSGFEIFICLYFNGISYQSRERGIKLSSQVITGSNRLSLPKRPTTDTGFAPRMHPCYMADIINHRMSGSHEIHFVFG